MNYVSGEAVIEKGSIRILDYGTLSVFKSSKKEGARLRYLLSLLIEGALKDCTEVGADLDEIGQEVNEWKKSKLKKD